MVTRILCALLAAALLAPAAALAADPSKSPPLGTTSCKDMYGVRFCGATAKTPSWDGVPLDADVTLPPASAGAGPYPTIVMLHGYGGSKTDFETDSPEPKDASGKLKTNLYHYNNVWFAQHGYAVLTYSARGFGDSCGRNSQSPDCVRTAPAGSNYGGYIHLKDQRIEVRDTQHLLGLLVDGGYADPKAIGATGISYGGGESIELAYLKDRIRQPDGSFAPLLSPGQAGKPETRTPFAIAAAWPRWPWSDLVSALLPNGRFLDTDPATDGLSRTPIGVPLQSYITGLYALGNTNGRYSVPGQDFSADITTWFARVNGGEPYDDPETKMIADEIFNYHQGFGIPASTPAPLLIENGWTDDLFPPEQALRVYNDLRAKDPAAPVSLQLGDLGHSRGSNKIDTNRVFDDQGTEFFDHYLKGAPLSAANSPGAATAMTQTCPQDVPPGGPFTAASWPELHPTQVSFAVKGTQTVLSAGGDPQMGKNYDPIAGTSDACKTTTAEDEPGTASYTLKVARAFTMLGLPTVRAKLTLQGQYFELASRLWDVAPDGSQILVSRAMYRPTSDQSGKVVTFQLRGNAYRFAAGHTIKLQLLGRDAPTFRPSNGQFSIDVSDLSATLPALDATEPVAAGPAQGGPSGAQGGGGSGSAGGGSQGATGGSGGRSGSCRPDPLERATARPRGRGLRFVLPAGSGRATVDVFAESAGRMVIGNRLVARFSNRGGSFAWSGRGRRVADGVYMVRFRSGSRSSRMSVERRGGRFRSRPDYSVSPRCGTIALFKLERPVLGGVHNRAVDVSYRLRSDARATVRVIAGGRTLRTFGPRSVRAGRTVRLRLASERMPRGTIRVVLSLAAAGAQQTRTLAARRL